MSTEDDAKTDPQAAMDTSTLAMQDQNNKGAGLGGAHEKLRLIDPLPENVEVLDVRTSHRLHVRRVLQSSLDHELDDVMVIGWRDDGPIFFLATDPNIGNAVYRLELAKQHLLAAVPDRWDTEIPTTRDIPDEPA